MLTERAGDGVCARAAKIASLLDVSPASSTAARSTSSKPHSSGSGLAPLSTGGSGGLSGEPLGEAAARQRSCDGAQLLDTSALAAQHASEAAATAAALQQHLETMAIKASDSSSAACAPAAAAAAARAAAAAATVAAMVAPDTGAAAPSSAAAAAMLNINICSTALAALAPRAADLGTLNSEFAAVLDETEDYLDPHCFAGADAANASKNRYINILPYDSNRVPLDPAAAAAAAANAAAASAAPPLPRLPPARKAPKLFGESWTSGPGSLERGSSSYFNGSFIRDPTVDGAYACGYVATQGPLPATVPDFWQAMRVAQCSAVVMLTNYVDFGRAKCAPYFPETEGQFMQLPGRLSIKCVHKAQLSADLAIRQLEVCYPVGKYELERQWVNHYHYTSWPDHGVPPTTAGVRALCHALDDCRRASCNIAVHCSAGVGRTGAFVAIDMLLQRLQRLRLQPPGAITGAAVTEAVDVQALVLALRGQRRGMVQTGAQYEFVYHALVDDLKEGIQAGQEMLLVAAEAEHLEAEQAAAAAAAAAATATSSGHRGLWARSRGKERSGGAGGVLR